MRAGMGMGGPWGPSCGMDGGLWRIAWVRCMARLVTFPPTVHIMKPSGQPARVANCERKKTGTYGSVPALGLLDVTRWPAVFALER